MISNESINNVDDFLAHYGVQGMKWGVRRYQNTSKANNVKTIARDKARQEKSSSNVKKFNETGKAREVRRVVEGKTTADIILGTAGKMILAQIAGTAVYAAGMETAGLAMASAGNIYFLASGISELIDMNKSKK